MIYALTLFSSGPLPVLQRVFSFEAVNSGHTKPEAEVELTGFLPPDRRYNEMLIRYVDIAQALL